MTNQFDCKTCVNKNCFIQHCDANSLSFVNSKKRTDFYKSGQMIIYENTPMDRIYFVFSGKAKVYATGAFGRQQIIRFANRGDIIGHRGINRDKWFISASVLEDSYICYIAAGDFIRLVENNRLLMHSLLLFFADELFRSEMKVKKLAMLSVKERIADALLQIQRVFSPSGKNTGVYLSRQEIADFAGTTKEQVSRDLSEFKKDKIIDLNGKEIFILNAERLKNIARFSSDDIPNSLPEL